MTRHGDPIPPERLEAYLDGLVSPEERKQIEGVLRDHPEILSQVERQTQVDSALKRLFAIPSTPAERIDRIVTEHGSRPVAPTQPKSTRSRRWMAALASAAAIAWIIAWWQLRDPGSQTPFFEPRSVVQIYHEIVANGFEPYYECREQDRFAATFLRRQGQSLRLEQLPEGSRMLGLSYPGGLSRETTAMLCRIDQQPVMVFVDRLPSDQPLAMENGDAEVEVFRKEYHGLVMYEVTPFKASRVLDHLVTANAERPE